MGGTTQPPLTSPAAAEATQTQAQRLAAAMREDRKKALMQGDKNAIAAWAEKGQDLLAFSPGDLFVETVWTLQRPDLSEAYREKAETLFDAATRKCYYANPDEFWERLSDEITLHSSKADPGTKAPPKMLLLIDAYCTLASLRLNGASVATADEIVTTLSKIAAYKELGAARGRRIVDTVRQGLIEMQRQGDDSLPLLPAHSSYNVFTLALSNLQANNVQRLDFREPHRAINAISAEMVLRAGLQLHEQAPQHDYFHSPHHFWKQLRALASDSGFDSKLRAKTVDALLESASRIDFSPGHDVDANIIYEAVRTLGLFLPADDPRCESYAQLFAAYRPDALNEAGLYKKSPFDNDDDLSSLLGPETRGTATARAAAFCLLNGLNKASSFNDDLLGQAQILINDEEQNPDMANAARARVTHLIEKDYAWDQGHTLSRLSERMHRFAVFAEEQPETPFAHFLAQQILQWTFRDDMEENGWPGEDSFNANLAVINFFGLQEKPEESKGKDGVVLAKQAALLILENGDRVSPLISFNEYCDAVRQIHMSTPDPYLKGRAGIVLTLLRANKSLDALRPTFKPRNADPHLETLAAGGGGGG